MILIPEGFEVKVEGKDYVFHTSEYSNSFGKEPLGFAIGISAVPRNYLSREFLREAMPQIADMGLVDGALVNKYEEARGINWFNYFTKVAQKLVECNKEKCTWGGTESNDLVSLSSAMANIIHEVGQNNGERRSLDIVVKDVQTVPIHHPIHGIKFDKTLYGFEIHSIVYQR